MKKTLVGEHRRAANGRVTYEITNARPQLLFVITDTLQKHFDFSQASQPILGLDQVISEISRDSVKLLLGWDIWSGCYVIADSVESDGLVKEIGDYFDSLIVDDEFSEFVDER